MKIRSIEEIKNIKDSLFLVRVDFNIPMKSNRVVEDIKLRRSLKTIKYLAKSGGRVVLMSHFGRPKGRVNDKYSLKPVGRHLAKLLKKRVIFNERKFFSSKFDQAISRVRPGEVMLLENTRFYPGEKKNDFGFSKALSRNFDYFINDAFASCHRAHASVVGVAKFLPSFAGFSLLEEVNNLIVARDNPKKPLVVIIGGAKISTKIKIIRKFIPKAKQILLGGGLVNSLLETMGCEIGSSLIDKEGRAEAKKLRKYLGKKIVMPLDVVIGKAKTGRKAGIINVGKADPGLCKKGEAVYDIGPKTVNLYKKHIRGAKTVIWNGPLGYIELPQFAKATNEVARTIAGSRAKSYVGGGETLMVIEKLRLTKKYTFVSTGGGAMLEFLEGKKLPGLEPLKK